MTDEELADYLKITPAQVQLLGPKSRELFVNMAKVERQITDYINNKGPKPEGVLLDFERPRKRT